MKLSYYVITRVLLAMIAGVVGLLALQVFFAYLSELDIAKQLTWLQVLQYIFYRVPYLLLQILPTGVLLGAVVGLGVLANHSELTVMRAIGFSVQKVVGLAMLPAGLFVVLALVVNEWLLPISAVPAKKIRFNENFASLTGFWAVIPNDSYQSKSHQSESKKSSDDKDDQQHQAHAVRQIIHIGQADEMGNLQDVRRYTVQDGRLMSVLSAPTGAWLDGYTWQVYDAHQLNLEGQATATTYHRLDLTLPIAKQSIHLLTKTANDLSISELYAHKQLMTHQGTTSPLHELTFWQKLLAPFSLLGLVVVACSFVFSSLRSKSLGFRIVLALLTGLLFGYLQDLSGFVALAMGLPSLIMVLLPIVLSVGVGVWLLNKQA